MKATELMLNDFLYYKNHGEVVRVSEIIGGMGECVRVSFNKKNNIRSKTPAVLGCNLHPIKITEEWLELNGFTKVSNTHYQKDIGDIKIKLLLDFPGKNVLGVDIIDGMYIVTSHFFGSKSYVHVLQHITKDLDIEWIMPKPEK